MGMLTRKNPVTKTRFEPKRSTTTPAERSSAAKPSVYPSITDCSSATVAPKSALILERATLTIVTIGEPARGRILFALLDGRSLPATEVAQRSGITCQTTSSHLAKLIEGELLQVIPQGRHRYYRIANAGR
jgi:DNA-binding transcriptional ArsR family regulator